MVTWPELKNFWLTYCSSTFIPVLWIKNKKCEQLTTSHQAASVQIDQTNRSFFPFLGVLTPFPHPFHQQVPTPGDAFAGRTGPDGFWSFLCVKSLCPSQVPKLQFVCPNIAILGDKMLRNFKCQNVCRTHSFLCHNIDRA